MLCQTKLGPDRVVHCYRNRPVTGTAATAPFASCGPSPLKECWIPEAAPRAGGGSRR